MLERHEIDAFLTLAEELHFGRAAERLHVSTARVSQTIRKLERRVGVPLFNRTSRRVELSAVGRRLNEDLRPAWEQVAAALTRAIDTGRGFTGTLRVCFTGAAGGVGADDTTRLGSSGRRLPRGFGGKLSRTSARASSVAAPPFGADGRGGRVIRTVSFLGSFGSLIVEISSAAKFR